MLIWFSEKFLKRVIGRTDLENGIKKLDKLTNEEVVMASAQLLKVAHKIAENQVWDSLKKWQSPPDPSTNHHIASDRQHEGTAEWLIDGDKFRKWMVDGALLWIHGKGTFLSSVTSVISWTTRSVAGSGKSILWFVLPSNLHYWETYCRRLAPQSSTMS